jgi:hypothetical protein
MKMITKLGHAAIERDTQQIQKTSRTGTVAFLEPTVPPVV